MKHLVLLLLLAPLAAPAGELLRVENSLDAMGTTFTVVAYGPDQNVLIAATEQAFEEVRRLDRMLSNYRPESELSQINRFGAERPVAVGPELFRLLVACVEYGRLSEGTFDITVGPLMKVWGFYKGSGRLPHRAEIRGVLGKVGYKNILLDEKAQTVRLARPGMELDPGGVGKGYAVDRVVAVLEESGLQSALVTAGGSSIYALGTPPGEPGWKVKIRNPKNPRETIDEMTLRDLSMSTSGNYEKFFRAEGKLYSHIMDPRTGFPAQGMLSVSVVSPKTLDSEVWAKPFYILGREWAARNRPKGFRVFLCEDKAGMACAWLQ
jgi:thiamine biosynthesis lipoprotein